MTTLFPFQLTNPNILFSFQPTLDGQIYTVTTIWNVWSQRWYIQITDQFGTVVVTKALVGSPAQQSAAAISWDDGVATITTLAPLPYRVGTVAPLSIVNCIPDAYNGASLRCVIQDLNTFTYPLPADPGPATTFGSYSPDINLVWGYFFQSTLVFRPSSGNFEVSP